jgi:hypothetical protein
MATNNLTVSGVTTLCESLLDLEKFVPRMAVSAQDGRWKHSERRGGSGFYAAVRTPSRVAASVLISDSFGSFWMIGSIIHAIPNGTSRVREIARHSMHTPSPRSWNRQ